MSAIDKLKNAAENAMGKGKEATGKTTGNDKLRAEGDKDQRKASLKDAGDNVKDASKD